MSKLLNGDCLEEMKTIDDKSIDLIFCDLPYGQTSCKWDCKIDLELFWNEIMRIKKLNTPIFFTTTTKFGVDLITSAPKKCHFRYDIVWVKSAPAGFLSAKKMPMRKHEMVYVFYEKLPLYDLSSHKHKFIKNPDPKIIKDTKLGTNTYGTEKRKKPILRQSDGQMYDPPLPVSVVKEETGGATGKEKGCYGEKVPNSEAKYGQKCARQYEPPLPVSVVKEECTVVKRTDEGCDGLYGKETGKVFIYDEKGKLRNSEPRYDPPLPVSVVKEKNYEENTRSNKAGAYGDNVKLPESTGQAGAVWEPPLPTSIVKEGEHNNHIKEGQIYNGGKEMKVISDGKGHQYNPPLPTSTLEIKSTRGKHSTEKPVALMEWILKYYSKEGDAVLDPTMGSGSTGVACKNMNRNFIGIEKDPEIYEVAVNRIEK